MFYEPRRKIRWWLWWLQNRWHVFMRTLLLMFSGHRLELELGKVKGDYWSAEGALDWWYTTHPGEPLPTGDLNRLREMRQEEMMRIFLQGLVAKPVA